MSTKKKVLIIVGSIFGFIIVVGVILAAIAIPSFQKFQEKAREKEGMALMGMAYQSAYSIYVEKGKFPQSCEELGIDSSMLSPGMEFYYRGGDTSFEVSARAAKTKTIYKMDKDKNMQAVEEHLQGPDVQNCIPQ